MSSIEYITYPIDSEPDDLLQDAITYIQSVYPGWQPRDGNLDTVILEAFAAMASDVRLIASQVPTSIFRYFGASLIGLQPIDATPATVQSTWTALDNSGHTIVAETQVGIKNSTGETIPFYVQSDVIIPPGSTATAAGAVTLIAANPGAATTNLGVAGGTVVLIDPLDWVASITQTGATSGGVDAETDAAYLNRLRGRLQLLAPRPILPADFAALALSVAGVAYAFAINGYNPLSGTQGNARTVAVVLMDASGNPVSSSVKSAVQTYLQSLREVNFVVNAIDPSITAVQVTYAVTRQTGQNSVTVKANIDAAITAYLDPANWIAALPTGGTPSPTVRYLELAQVINNVPGVDFITSLTLGLQGGTLTSADVALSGVTALPDVGTITGTVT